MRRPADSRAARVARVSTLDPGDPRDLYALRDALVLDPDAEVRAASLLRLDASAATALLPYVRDATRDRAASVREAAFVVLARAADVASLPRAAHASRHDRSFRVHRMAVLFAARACGARALPVLAVASRDPFWRVRAAARRAGAALDAPIDATAVRGAPPACVMLPAFEDPDPAVITKRLDAIRRDVAPAALVGLLGQSHLALRRIAVKEIAARGDAATLRDVTRWLVDERVPYGPSAAEVVLARSGARGAAVAAEMLLDEEAPAGGPLAWALRAAVRSPAWSRLKPLLAHDDARVRLAASLRVPEAAPDREILFRAMERLLDDEDEDVQVSAGSWLASTASRDAATALDRVPASPWPTLLRALLVDLRRELRDLGGLRALADDVHAGVRAAALAALSELDALTARERRACEADPDPWVRNALLRPEQASRALHDPSNEVRRAALELLEDSEAREAWAIAASAEREPDPFLRARAAHVLAGLTTDEATRALLRLARDADLGVRSAAAEALEGHRGATRRLLEAGALDRAERIAANTLLRLGGVEDLACVETDPEVMRHVALLEDVLDERAPATMAPRSRKPRAPSPHERELGRTGLRVAPLGLSGAHGLTYADFARAHERGVNLFFWEPAHRELARFLRASRRSSIVLVAGSYHADAASIERHVHRTLRASRRDAVDVFLAFWARSSARLDDVLEPLLALKQRGLIRAAGVSTHDRALARAAADRGLDVVMVRHSAAHRGAEDEVFPHCMARGTGVLTFSSLCYGRMLHRTPVQLSAKVTAPDCYRYSLSQPGVHACIAAPRRSSELASDLEVLDEPSLDTARQEEMRAHGDHVYARSKAWSAETWGVAEAPEPRVHPQDEELSDSIEQPSSLSPDVW